MRCRWRLGCWWRWVPVWGCQVEGGFDDDDGVCGAEDLEIEGAVVGAEGLGVRIPELPRDPH